MSQRRLGNYLMLETLGQGGFSKVRLGVDEKTGERVALKILKKKEMGVTADVIKQVEREIHAMSQISHQNVIRLKEVQWDATYEKKNGTKLQVILVVLELATGGELFDFLAFTGPFEDVVARTFFLQLVSGLGHCHSKGIAHRDLKPENLLLSSDFVLKIADFGFANTFNSVQGDVMYTECGTPGYMAPEVFSKKGYDAAAADIWSCGVVLFIQLAGFPPFQRPAMNDWWFNKLYNNKHALFWQAHQRTAYFSDLVKDFLNKILCPDPSKRMSLTEMAKHPWMLGPTISHSALYAELARRKATVEESKNRERAEKAGKIVGAEAGGQGGLLERGDVSMTRGEGPAVMIDYAAESLPPVVPSMTSFAKGVAAGPVLGGGAAGEDAPVAHLGGGGAGGVMDGSAFGGEGGEESFAASWGRHEGEGEGEGEDAAPGAASSSSAAPSAGATAAPLFPASAQLVQSFTRFSTRSFGARATELFSVLQNCFASLGFTVESSAKEKFKFSRVKCVTGQGVIVFSAAVYADPAAPDACLIVDFKKKSADGAQFRTLFAEMRHKLDDIVDREQSQTLATPQQLGAQQEAGQQPGQ